MGSEKAQDYYNSRLGRVTRPLEQSPWLTVYSLVADLLPKPEAGIPIADLGCGTGRLAKLLHLHGHQHYWGVDFSEARILEASSYCPELTYEVGNLFDPEIQRRFVDFKAFVITEVLEHVENDLDLLRAVPSGAQIICSVPNYDSAGHVRTFATADDATKRYSEVMTIEDVVVLPRRRAGRKIFVLNGTRL